MKARLAAVMLAVLLAAGCVGTGGGQPTATMGLYLADTRTGGAGVLHDVSEIWITITEIQGERDGRWEVVAEVAPSAGRINLLDLGLQARLLRETRVPAGKYSRFRLVLSEADGAQKVVAKDGREFSLTVPGGKLEVKSDDVAVAPQAVVELVLDIDADQFVLRNETDAGFVVNPNFAARLLNKDALGSISVRVELPPMLREMLDEILPDLTITLMVARAADGLPINEVALSEGVLEATFDVLLPGEYSVTAVVAWQGHRWELRSSVIKIDPGVTFEDVLK